MNRNASISSAAPPVLAAILEAGRIQVDRLRRNARSVRSEAEARLSAADFEAALRLGDTMRVIAEVKRRSPSAGSIREDVVPASQAELYERAGAAAISVLTETAHFGGTLADLEAVVQAVPVMPILRKDFTIDPLQVYEARAAGAAAVLLIARILDDSQLNDFGALADDLAMCALFEVHDEEEIERVLKAGARVIGINNRDLSRFTTDLAVTERLARYVPPDVVLIAESGIDAVADVKRMSEAGADAVLVGETLMRAEDPVEMIAMFNRIPRGER